MALASLAQDCSHLWQHDLNTGTQGPKGYMGDTHAAYGVFSLYRDNSKYYVLKGKFPKARFFSVETYKGRKNFPVQTVFDSQINPDPGSLNPFTPGVSLNETARDYTIVVKPEGTENVGPNPMKLSRRERMGSIWIRYYSPSAGVQVKPEDLPRIEAYDVKTHQPTQCPKTWKEDHFTNYPQFLGYLAKKQKGVFPFELFQVNWAGNSGVGKYSQGNAQMNFNEVFLVRFRPPTYVETFSGAGSFNPEGQLRYWSLCSIDTPGNRGLMCYADHELTPDADGFVTVVQGTGNEVAEEAKKRGYYFVPDLRPKDAVMALFAFRNILPSPDFAQNGQYQGDYNPKGRICTKEVFLKGDCEWWD